MKISIPAADGEINEYNLSRSGYYDSRIYFINGIRVSGQDHAITASLLSLLIERPIFGVYNKSAGTKRDLGQSALDYLQNVFARFRSRRNLNRAAIPDHEVKKLLERKLKRVHVWNQATLKLFKSLVEHRHRCQRIIAHSQGNLITSNALFVLENMLGASALRKIRVYSLASPAPAWPFGLRKTEDGGGRQVNAFMNDFVVLLRPHNLLAKLGLDRFQNEGDYRTLETGGRLQMATHDIRANIALNFLKSIRGDLGLSKELPPDFLERCVKKAEQAFGLSQHMGPATARI